MIGKKDACLTRVSDMQERLLNRSVRGTMSDW